MSHARAAIREAVVAALVAADTAAAARVFDSPNDPRVRWPSLVVEDVSERQEVRSGRGTGATVRRSLLIEVAAEVQQTSGYAQARDDLLAEVETALAAALGTVALPGVQNLQPAGTEFAKDTSGERPIVVGAQRFEITYITTQGAPGTPQG